ncbi:MAG: hypothetical protein DMG13_30475 [Acidobacteria bacterium]|nr:MAG: hypothetical protein DMG13_30475 [Acidobacteriota bacterium]
MRRRITQTVTIGPLIVSLLGIVGGLLNAQTLGNGIPDFSVGASSITGIPLAEAPIRDLDGVRFVSEGLFTINDPRPLERAAELLRRKLRVPISYEDAAWMAGRDVMQAADYPG